MYLASQIINIVKYLNVNIDIAILLKLNVGRGFQLTVYSKKKMTIYFNSDKMYKSYD